MTETNTIQLTRQTYEASAGKTTFLMQDQDGNTFEHYAAQIIQNPTLLDSLTPRDAAKIGYIAGIENN